MGAAKPFDISKHLVKQALGAVKANAGAAGAAGKSGPCLALVSDSYARPHRSF
jgi:hypothetical protein